MKRKVDEAGLGTSGSGTDDGDILELMPIGAGNEVGRSCILLKFKGKHIMLDCGIHPAYSGLAALPYFDMIDDPSTIDLLLVSHFHLDHCASLPYFLEKSTFKGRVFMTHPTKAIYKMLLTDYVKVSNIAVEDMLYDEQDLINTMDKIEPVNYHQQIEVNGIKFSSYNAGHVLGEAMFRIEIAGVRILYTGDFSRQEDRHLMAAETPPEKPDIVIVESTYGVQIHEPRLEREARFTKLVHGIVRRGGRCLIPVFALGRAQELLLILDEYWEAHPELHKYPIYYASTLAKKCMSVYQTYINMMNDNIREQFAVSNPFVFKHISNLKSMQHFDDVGPCVVMASPGMLQSGLSRELFELWCTNSKNGVVIPGYCVEGTLAKTIMSEPSEITKLNGETVPLKMSVHYISFSAHSDFLQTSGFLDILMPPYVILVHGDANEMSRLKASLVNRYEGKNIEILTPKNCQTVQLKFRGAKTAKVVGSLASVPPREGTIVAGLLVRKDFGYTILAAGDVNKYTQIVTTAILQKQLVPFHQPFSVLEGCLSQIFDEVQLSTSPDNLPLIKVHGNIGVEQTSASQVTLQWESNPVNDMIADSIVALLLQLESNPKSFKIIESEDTTRNNELIKQTLNQHFGEENVQIDEEHIHISNSHHSALVHLPLNTSDGIVVECEDAALKQRVEAILEKIKNVLYPIMKDYPQ
jgi:cleavage and polyadenylation specificity factor subunit 3